MHYLREWIEDASSFVPRYKPKGLQIKRLSRKDMQFLVPRRGITARTKFSQMRQTFMRKKRNVLTSFFAVIPPVIAMSGPINYLG